MVFSGVVCAIRFKMADGCNPRRLRSATCPECPVNGEMRCESLEHLMACLGIERVLRQGVFLAYYLVELARRPALCHVPVPTGFEGSPKQALDSIDCGAPDELSL